MALVDEQREPHGVQAGGQRQVIASMSLPGVLEPLFAEHEQRLVQTVQRVDRRRVMVGPGPC